MFFKDFNNFLDRATLRNAFEWRKYHIVEVPFNGCFCGFSWNSHFLFFVGYILVARSRKRDIILRNNWLCTSSNINNFLETLYTSHIYNSEQNEWNEKQGFQKFLLPLSYYPIPHRAHPNSLSLNVTLGRHVLWYLTEFYIEVWEEGEKLKNLENSDQFQFILSGIVGAYIPG